MFQSWSQKQRVTYQKWEGLSKNSWGINEHENKNFKSLKYILKFLKGRLLLFEPVIIAIYEFLVQSYCCNCLPNSNWKQIRLIKTTQVRIIKDNLDKI